MVIVAVGQYDSFQFINGNVEFAIFPVRFGPSALKRPAVNQNRAAVNLENMF
jgi:hypothetical protein